MRPNPGVTKIAALVFVLSAAGASNSYAQSEVNVFAFSDRPYYEPLKVDPRAAKMTLIVPAWSKEFPHSQEPGTRFVWQITLGRELPIFGVSNQVRNDRAQKGKWGFGLWIPVSFHMIEDHKDTSAPIVDTDYRYGFMTKFQYGLGESTQLGIQQAATGQ